MTFEKLIPTIRIMVISILFLTNYNAFTQFTYTHQDSIIGSITPERKWWDVNFYNLDIDVDPENRFISGSNLIAFTALEAGDILQIDLQYPMKITKVMNSDGKPLEYTRDGFAYFIKLDNMVKKDEAYVIQVFYEGSPRTARKAPWDGGFSWSTDSYGNHFIATSCQGEGASLWWPCKDHYYDEVDSMHISVTVPSSLKDVSNGRLKGIDTLGSNKLRYNWVVSNPINNYGVNLNIANYAQFGEPYEGLQGTLDCNYFVLPENLTKAKKHFTQVALMLEAFEHWFGPYPFYEDGFKLVEVPYLGMEHQSSVTYGNGYQNGYYGSDLSGSGWGKKFDFIIIHESGHEWFANNITCRDVADLWVHEGFTAYSENLFVDYYYGKEAAADYVIGTRRNIKNDRPIIGDYNVRNEGSTDMYYKGANILHMIRNIIDDDSLWRSMLIKMNRDFRHQTVSSATIEKFISENAGIDFSSLFDQYLRTTNIPVFEWDTKGKTMKYRYKNCIKDFNMPIKLLINHEKKIFHPTTEWQSYKHKSKIESCELYRDFYVTLSKFNGQ